MAANQNTMDTVLRLVPQQAPFRFIDEIVDLSPNRIESNYTFKNDEYFYQGHFADYPITPGVILIETMAQSGVVALGIYQLLELGMEIDSLRRITPLFAFVDQVEFAGIVKPGERVRVIGEKVYYRRGNIKSTVKIENDSGHLICHGLLTGAGVNTNA